MPTVNREMTEWRQTAWHHGVCSECREFDGRAEGRAVDEPEEGVTIMTVIHANNK